MENSKWLRPFFVFLGLVVALKFSARGSLASGPYGYMYKTVSSTTTTAIPVAGTIPHNAPYAIALWFRVDEYPTHRYAGAQGGPNDSPGPYVRTAPVVTIGNTGTSKTSTTSSGVNRDSLCITPEGELVIYVCNPGGTFMPLALRTGVSLQLGVWNHIVLNRTSPTQIVLYVNGVSSTTFDHGTLTRPDSDDTAWRSNTWALRFGWGLSIHMASATSTSPDPMSSYLNGAIAHIKLWKSALTASEVIAEVNRVSPAKTAGLYAYFATPTEDVGNTVPSRGGDLDDDSGNGNHLARSLTARYDYNPVLNAGPNIVLSSLDPGEAISYAAGVLTEGADVSLYASDIGGASDLAALVNQLSLSLVDVGNGEDRASMIAAWLLAAADLGGATATARATIAVVMGALDAGSSVDTAALAGLTVLAALERGESLATAAPAIRVALATSDLGSGHDVAAPLRTVALRSVDEGLGTDSAGVGVAQTLSGFDYGEGLGTATPLVKSAYSITSTDVGAGTDRSAVSILVRVEASDVSAGLDIVEPSTVRTLAAIDLGSSPDTASRVHSITLSAQDYGYSIDTASVSLAMLLVALSLGRADDTASLVAPPPVQPSQSKVLYGIVFGPGGIGVVRS